jgi:hypothetical protein
VALKNPATRRRAVAEINDILRGLAHQGQMVLVKRHHEELQRRILELIQDLELKTDWRVRIVAYDATASTDRITVPIDNPI